MRIGVVLETHSLERRVALVPEDVTRLVRAGHALLVERGAGLAAGFGDALYERAGGQLLAAGREVIAFCEILVKVRPPSLDEASHLSNAAWLVGLLAPWQNCELLRVLAS